jgi:DNA (cytosine-5)-methyltransferase 1
MSKPQSYTIGSLFSGIGGLELGLERSGLGETIWQCESDPYAQRVLAKHWPGVKCYEDIRGINGATPRPDIICGGFPCQDISVAGKGAGLEGERSGLWGEMLRVVRLLRPRIVIMENVPALLARGLGVVLGELAESGYDRIWWDCIPASAVGAPHRRDRVFAIAHTVSGELRDEQGGWCRESGQGEAIASDHGSNGWWATQPGVGMLADGVRSRAHQLRCLGNAVVPQVAEVIGRIALELMVAIPLERP